MTRWWWSLPVDRSNPEATFTNNREGSRWLPSLVYPSAAAHCDWRAATGHVSPLTAIIRVARIAQVEPVPIAHIRDPISCLLHALPATGRSALMAAHPMVASHLHTCGFDPLGERC